MKEQAGDLKEAENDYRQAVACSADPGQAATIATFCETRGWLEAAATNYAAGLQLDPTNVKLRMAAAKNLYLMANYGAATEQFRQALAIKPDSAEIRLALGEALLLNAGSGGIKRI